MTFWEFAGHFMARRVFFTGVCLFSDTFLASGDLGLIWEHLDRDGGYDMIVLSQLIML